VYIDELKFENVSSNLMGQKEFLCRHCVHSNRYKAFDDLCAYFRYVFLICILVCVGADSDMSFV